MNLKYFISIYCIIISFYLFKLVHILLLLHLILFHNIPLHIFLFISFKLFYFTPSVICFCGGFFNLNFIHLYIILQIWDFVIVFSYMAWQKWKQGKGVKKSNLWEKLIRKSCKFTKEQVIQLLEQRLIYRDRMKKMANVYGKKNLTNLWEKAFLQI